MTEETKRCTKCGEIKPISHFRIVRRGESWRQGYCNQCRNISERKRLRRLGVRPWSEYAVSRVVTDGSVLKQCSICHEFKPISEFVENKARRDGTVNMCLPCFNERSSRLNKKARRCAKIFCKNLTLVVELTCLVCGKKYGMRTSEYNAKMRGDELHHPKYCSPSCQHISMTKAWREKSPYAKKIKDLQKQHEARA